MQQSLTIGNELQVEGVSVADIFGALDINASTREEYIQRIRFFLLFVKGRRLNYDTYLEFKRHLGTRNDLSVSTKNKYLFTAKVFLREIYRRGLIPTDITAGVKGFQQSKKNKRPGLTDDDVALLSEALRQLGDTPAAPRLKAMFCLLTFQGLRQIEIIRLNVTNIDLVRQVAFVQGKGSDDTEPVNLHPETVNALRDYMKAFKLADGPLFTSLSNNGRNARLTTRSLRRIVRNLLVSLDILDKSTHGFRHYFTTKLIKTYKGDLLEVRNYTRHSSLEMLQIYNDNIKHEEDLPRYYGAFKGVSLQ